MPPLVYKLANLLDFKSTLLQGIHQEIAMVALNFNYTLFYGSPGAAHPLEIASQFL